MKRIGILFLSIILYMPIVARGDVVTEDSVFAGLHELEAFVSQELEIIEEKMKELNPRLVESAANDSDMVKIIKYNNWMAEYIFDEYRDFFVWDLRQQSEKTGRKIRSSFDPDPSIDYSARYWLDNGIMETEQCNGGQYRMKGDTCFEWHELFQDEREHTCLYPDGFEEYTVNINEMDSLSDSNNSYWSKARCEGCDVVKKIAVFQDNAHDNVRRKYDVKLTGSSEIGGKGDQMTRLHLWVSETIIDYSKYQDWRNRTQQDIIDGKYTDGMICEPSPKSECIDRGYEDGSCVHVHNGPDWKKWKSNRGMPMGTVHGEEFDYSLTTIK